MTSLHRTLSGVTCMRAMDVKAGQIKELVYGAEYRHPATILLLDDRRTRGSA